MRIQHNIAAMNAYRNYNLNTSAVTKNLEKLSSGYKINRAGDDAAGLAISEKMRAQISGLEAASKNVKDGISLVKTAEGAMQEVQDMLNRMVTLATQSANGTYDNETDRAALQQEVDQLNSEIDRIADSANFNGIKLLDGSLDANGRVATTETVFAGMKIGNNVNGIAPTETTKANSADKIGGSNTKGGVMLTGQYSALSTGKPYESDDSIRYHKDAAEAGKTSFTIDLDGLGYEAASGTAVEGLQFVLQAGAAGQLPTAAGDKQSLFLKDDGTGALTYSVVANGEGKITSEDIAKAIQKVIDDNDGKVYIKTGMLKGDGATAGTPAVIEYSVTREGDKLKFEMTDKGYTDACAAANTDAAGNKTGENYFQGNFNFSVAGQAASGNATPTEADKFKDANTDKLVGNTSSCEVNEGTTPKGTIYAQAYIRFNETNTAVAASGINKATDYVADGKGFKIGDEYYVFAGSDATFNTEYADNVKVVDIRDLTNLTDAKANGTAADKLAFTDDLRKALDRLSVAAKDNEMFDVQVEERGTIIAINERTTYTGDANLTEKDRGLEKQIQAFNSAQSTTTVTKEAGNALTLQIGDTSEDFNQLKVNIGDVHAAALGVSGLSIADQESAGDAINTIRSAINQVSSIRGTLGATQNRLEHTSNNLSVMTENIQDAESTIRDTDIAEEMMSYTKNNILVQSAQAMLAQANQIPQGVLQLLG
ncbi:flagellin N-terminal helical domain-containing protein [Lawsonibacter sp. JLR.KK007]|uniref:flagellin N-terminal helical domain-containing protein n=1 Tax=Lawsonibacter sp. JLR.KK007 TaxID=3114293 RepID=UPI002FF12C20